MKNVAIMEKSSSYSWDDVKECLWESHSLNRKKGIFLESVNSTPQKLDKIFSKEQSRFFLAVDDNNRILACCGVCKRENGWLSRFGRTAELCFVGVRPQYAGMGLFSKLLNECKKYCEEVNISVLYLNTTFNNHSMQKAAAKNGFVLVDYDVFKGVPYYYVRMAFFYKRVSRSLLNLHFLFRKVYIKIRYKSDSNKRFF